jgi:hypothetical protein
MIDLTLVGWILLFLCRSLDHTSLNNDDSSKAARKDNGMASHTFAAFPPLISILLQHLSPQITIHCFVVIVGNSLPNRWNFIQGDHNSAGSLAAANSAKAKSTKLVRGSRLSMQKRMLHHKQKLMDLQQAQKTFFSTHPDKGAQNSSNTLLKQQEKEFKKELSKYASKVSWGTCDGMDYRMQCFSLEMKK